MTQQQSSENAVEGGFEDHDIPIINDEEANEVYLKISLQTQNRKGYIKKNWAEEETKLLKWAVITYTR